MFESVTRMFTKVQKCENSSFASCNHTPNTVHHHQLLVRQDLEYRQCVQTPQSRHYGTIDYSQFVCQDDYCLQFLECWL